jgi:hypothetical protein
MDIKWRRKAFLSCRVPNKDIRALNNPAGPLISYFEKYFTKQLINTFSEAANNYAFQNDSRIKNTSPTEIQQLIGLHMYMGCKQLPRLRLY